MVGSFDPKRTVRSGNNLKRVVYRLLGLKAAQLTLEPHVKLELVKLKNEQHGTCKAD